MITVYDMSTFEALEREQAAAQKGRGLRLPGFDEGGYAPRVEPRLATFGEEAPQLSARYRIEVIEAALAHLSELD